MTEQLEIERKYLLKYNPLNLGEFDNLLQITQLYLPKDENGYTVRYRYITDTNGNVRYVKTSLRSTLLTLLAKKLKLRLLRLNMKRLKK